MKIGLIGGTGNMGRGLALRLAFNHEILLGSRFFDKARNVAKEQGSIAKGFYQDEMQGSFNGDLNRNVIKKSEIVIVALPARAAIPVMQELGDSFNQTQVVVSTVVPMEKRGRLFKYAPLSSKRIRSNELISAAELIQEIVKPAPVVTAFQTVPAAYLNNIDAVLNIDVFIAGDDNPSLKKISKLICGIPNLRPLKVGPLENSIWIESVTPLLINAAILNNLKEPSIRVVPWLPTSYDVT